MTMDLRHAKKLADDIFRGVWFYFGLPPTFLQETVQLPEYHRVRINDTITFCIIKATVVDILESRDVNGLLFEVVFSACSQYDKDAFSQIKIMILTIIESEDDCSAFFILCAITCDFVLFLRYKQDFLNVTRTRLINFWCDFFFNYFHERLKQPRFLPTIAEAALKKAGIYPYEILQEFARKYCSPYITNSIPTLFELSVREKYSHGQDLSNYSEIEIILMKK